MKLFFGYLALAVLFGCVSLAQAAVIIDADVENDGDWTIKNLFKTPFNSTGFGFLTPGFQEGTKAAVFQNDDSISQTFTGQTLQVGTYTVEFALGNYSNAPFPNVTVDFTGLNLSSSIFSNIPTPGSGSWELWNISWDVTATTPGLGNDLSFELATPGPLSSNLAFDGVGSLSSNGSGFLVSFTPIPEPSTLVLFGIGVLGMLGIGWRRRRKQAT